MGLAELGNNIHFQIFDFKASNLQLVGFLSKDKVYFFIWYSLLWYSVSLFVCNHQGLLSFKFLQMHWSSNFRINQVINKNLSYQYIDQIMLLSVEWYSIHTDRQTNQRTDPCIETSMLEFKNGHFGNSSSCWTFITDLPIHLIFGVLKPTIFIFLVRLF